MPHIQYPNSVYFITTRCLEGKFLTPNNRDIVIEAIKHLNGVKYILYAVAVMPDHFHIIMQSIEKCPGSYYSLSEIMHSIKSFTSHKMQHEIWQHENFDRIIRDEQELFENMNYIINNPVETGLVENPDDYKWLFYISQVNK